LYVDNYACLVDFDLPLKPLTLLLGENGSGKSMVLEVLQKLRDFVTTFTNVGTSFPKERLTRWSSNSRQRFELGLAVDEGEFRYSLEVEIATTEESSFVVREELRFESIGPLTRVILSGSGGDCTISENGDDAAMKVVGTRDRSAVSATFLTATPGSLLARFQDAMRRSHVLRVVPERITSRFIRGEGGGGDSISTRFSSWLYDVKQQIPDKFSVYEQKVASELLDGFTSFEFRQSFGPRWTIQLRFGAPAATNPSGGEFDCEMTLDELSDGQKALLVLYSLIYLGQHPGWICIDEPENFLALPEIQPWLIELEERVYQGKLQAILASHHPEVINLLVGEGALWLERDEGGPTRILTIGPENDTGLKFSELIARGWING